MDQQAGNKDQSVNCECGDMSGVIGPLADRADASDEAYRRRRAIPRAGIDVVVRHAVYTGVQMLEKRLQNCHFRHFPGSSAQLPGGTACSARRCRIMRSDMIGVQPGHPKTECVWVHRNCHIEFRWLFTI